MHTGNLVSFRCSSADRAILYNQVTIRIMPDGGEIKPRLKLNVLLKINNFFINDLFFVKKNPRIKGTPYC